MTGKEPNGTDPGRPLLEQLEAWLSALPAQQPAEWPQLPDIGLYMDQVVTYIDRQLSLHRNSEKDHPVTAAMVNNYIKDGLLPRAELKKYAPTHLALLTLIGALKPVLSMQDLLILLGGSRDGRSVPETYGRFLAGQKAAVAETAADVSARLQELENRSPAASALEADSPAVPAASGLPDPETLAGLRVLALDLAIEARVRILIAEQLLATVSGAERAVQAQKLALDTGDKTVKKKQKPQV